MIVLTLVSTDLEELVDERLLDERTKIQLAEVTLLIHVFPQRFAQFVHRRHRAHLDKRLKRRGSQLSQTHQTILLACQSLCCLPACQSLCCQPVNHSAVSLSITMLSANQSLSCQPVNHCQPVISLPLTWM